MTEEQAKTIVVSTTCPDCLGSMVIMPTHNDTVSCQCAKCGRTTSSGWTWTELNLD